MFEINDIFQAYESSFNSILKFNFQIIHISGVTGVGKTTLLNKLVNSRDKNQVLPRLTTRPKNEMRLMVQQDLLASKSLKNI